MILYGYNPHRNPSKEQALRSLINTVIIIDQNTALEDRVDLCVAHITGALLDHILVGLLGLSVGRIRGFGEVVIDNKSDDKGEDNEDRPLGDEFHKGEKDRENEEDKDEKEEKLPVVITLHKLI